MRGILHDHTEQRNQESVSILYEHQITKLVVGPSQHSRMNEHTLTEQGTRERVDILHDHTEQGTQE
jgi:hypothetical protein